jgi:hypothetical protein
MTILWEFGKTFWWGVPKAREIKKVTSSQDDDFVGVLTKNIQNKLALMGRRPMAALS